jgi:hypothetical protein
MRGPGAPRRHSSVPLGTGQFIGHQAPQAVGESVTSELLGGMLGDGAFRVARTTASNRRFTGGDLTPQTFIAPPSHPNDPHNGLEPAGRIGVGNTRRALNRHRGRLAV